mmetsp:Transcript_1259/g.3387  ORF Transcript_1259/g.3387 Transcript_1259/m.3387 type:complete len:134 (-) Transcript_1259:912-1313(-)
MSNDQSRGMIDDRHAVCHLQTRAAPRPPASKTTRCQWQQPVVTTSKQSDFDLQWSVGKSCHMAVMFLEFEIRIYPRAVPSMALVEAKLVVAAVWLPDDALGLCHTPACLHGGPQSNNPGNVMMQVMSQKARSS